MGFGGYDCNTRAVRSATLGFATKGIDQVFTQQAEAKSHSLMASQGVLVRECVDSEDHPNTVPIILGLDVTGSMGHIPHSLIKEGLPRLMGNVIENGCPDASLCFLAIGDSRSDRFPLQIAQFESSDELLDMWLTRTYLEGNGGGNGGESYLLAWEFAAKRTKIDSFKKRGQKGILITVGNEPCHPLITKRELEEVYGVGNSKAESSATKEELLAAAQKEWIVFHLNVGAGYGAESKWRENLGENFIQIDDYLDIPDRVAKIILDNSKNAVNFSSNKRKETVVDEASKQEVEIL